jgi:hypothetical protein
MADLAVNRTSFGREAPTDRSILTDSQEQAKSNHDSGIAFHLKVEFPSWRVRTLCDHEPQPEPIQADGVLLAPGLRRRNGLQTGCMGTARITVAFVSKQAYIVSTWLQ